MPDRFDVTRLDASKTTRTGSGAVRVPALATRSDVFEYRRADGSMVREWRPPEEVTRADSLDSLKDLPVTNRHPRTFVDPASWRATAIGHVSSESVRVDDTTKGALADLVISAGSEIPKIGSDLLEVSCGYRCDLDDTPGTVPSGYPGAGKRYDTVQRNIFYNHVAVGPKDWARQGPTTAMRLDAKGDEIHPGEETPKEDPMKYKIRFDGKTFEADTEEALQAQLDAHIASKATEDAKAKQDAKDGELAALRVQLQAEKERADAAPALAAAALKIRGDLEAKAVKVLGKSAKFDGKTDREVKVSVIKHFDSKFSDLEADGKTPRADAFIDGSFLVYANASITNRNDAGTNRIALGLGGNDGSGEHVDADDEEEEEEEEGKKKKKAPPFGKKEDAYDPDAARARMLRRDSGETPTVVTKKRVDGLEIG